MQASGLRVATHNFGGVAAAPPVPLHEREGFNSHSSIVTKSTFGARKALTDERRVGIRILLRRFKHPVVASRTHAGEGRGSVELGLNSVLNSKLFALLAGFEGSCGFEVTVAAENAGPVLECRPRTARAGKLVGVGIDYGEEAVLAAAGGGSGVRGHEVGTGCANLGPFHIAVLAYFTIGARGGSDARKFTGGAEEAGRLSWVGEGAGGAGVAEAGAVIADKAGVAIHAIVEASSSSCGELSRGARQTIIEDLVEVRTSQTLRRTKGVG